MFSRIRISNGTHSESPFLGSCDFEKTPLSHFSPSERCDRFRCGRHQKHVFRADREAISKSATKSPSQVKPSQAAKNMRFAAPVTRPVPIAPEVDMRPAATVNRDLPQELLPILAPVGSTSSSMILVLRGVAGIGKSSLAKTIYLWCQRNGLTCVVCTADIWHYDHDGTYHWEGGDRLRNAHNHCHGRFMLAMAMKTEVIVVDNMNLRPIDNQWYFDYYDMDEYDVRMVEIDCVDMGMAHRAANRSRRQGHLGPTYDAGEKFHLFQAHRHQGAIVIQPHFSYLDDHAQAFRNLPAPEN